MKEKTILLLKVSLLKKDNLIGLIKKSGIAGVKITEADSVDEVSELLKQTEINAIVYELNRGLWLHDLEFLKIVTGDIPKIVISKRADKKSLVELINSGSISYFLKFPFTEYELLQALNTALEYNEIIISKYSEITKKYFESQIQKLNQIGIALSSEHDLEKLLNQIVSQARFLAHCDAGSIYIVEDDELHFMVAQNETLRRRYGEDCAEKLFKRFRIPISRNRISGYVAATGETLNIKDVYSIPPGVEYSFTDDFDKRNNYRTVSMIVAPMKEPDGNIIGVLQLINCLDEEGNICPFDRSVEGLIQSLASQAAIAIRNTRLLNKVKEATLDTIMRLSVAAEFRDDDTAEHLRRISHTSIIIAKNFGLYKDEVELLQYAAPMHDIGKIGIPDSILLKPGKLTSEEWEEMKRHTIYGAKILGESDSEIVGASREVALTHHERWDGKGYPYGLKGEEISILGQIVSVADVFDALISKRSYKKAYPIEYALSIMKKGRERMFNPDIIDSFLKEIDRIVEKIKEISPALVDREPVY